jgi:hypothetical protein
MSKLAYLLVMAALLLGAALIMLAISIGDHPM